MGVFWILVVIVAPFVAAGYIGTRLGGVSACELCGGQMRDCLNEMQTVCIGRRCWDCDAFKPWDEDRWYSSPLGHPKYKNPSVNPGPREVHEAALAVPGLMPEGWDDPQYEE